MLQVVSPYLNPVVAVYAIILLCLYRFSSVGIHCVKTMYLLTLLLLNISWFINGGSTGSIAYFYLTAIVFPLVLFIPPLRTFMILLLVFNYTTLVLLEQRFPSLVVPFISSNDRYFDLLTGFAVSIFVIGIIFWVIVASYDKKLKEHGKVEEELKQYRLNLEALVEKRTKELHKSELRFRSFVENANDVVFSLSTDGIFTYVSPNWREVFGYELYETVQRPFAPFVHPDDLANCFSAMQRVFDYNEKAKDVEYRVLHKNGNWIWYSANASLLRDPETDQTTFLGIGRDITERKESEEERLTLERQFLQAQKMESLGIMAGGIAHDFNNLLQSILGNMELALRVTATDSAAREHISIAMVASKNATHLTNLMLTYAGKGFVHKKVLNLNELVMENVEILRSAASTAISLELSLFDELPEISADWAQIQQVAMNLITNAAESIEQQPGFVRIATGIVICDQVQLQESLLKEKAEPGRFVFLEVRDNGCGMSEETLKRLFDPFFTTKFTGRGLGMSAVMGIMKIHGGALFVESESGKGTIFRALFPVLEPALAATVKEPDAMGEKSAYHQKALSGVALLVDDEKPVLKTCKKMVELCGLTVITACDGIDAVAKFREHADEIDVVIMDLTMPNMDGITAISEICSIRPDIRTILASGFNEEELDERVTSHSPTGFISKPYSMNLLETELRRVMQED
jgi:PAS domain S-box-containing protein